MRWGELGRASGWTARRRGGYGICERMGMGDGGWLGSGGVLERVEVWGSV